MALKTKAKSTKISVNMAGVEVAKLVGEGIHKLKVNEVKKEVADSGKDKLEWKFGVTAGPFKNSTLYYNTSLQPQALWNLKGLLEALGVDVPDGVMDLDLKELVDMEVGGQVEHEVYEGKKRARIVDFMPIDEVTGEGGEEEEAAEIGRAHV